MWTSAKAPSAVIDSSHWGGGGGSSPLLGDSKQPVFVFGLLMPNTSRCQWCFSGAQETHEKKNCMIFTRSPFRVSPNGVCRGLILQSASAYITCTSQLYWGTEAEPLTNDHCLPLHCGLLSNSTLWQFPMLHSLLHSHVHSLCLRCPSLPLFQPSSCSSVCLLGHPFRSLLKYQFLLATFPVTSCPSPL